jgi:hypothetical protein
MRHRRRAIFSQLNPLVHLSFALQEYNAYDYGDPEDYEEGGIAGIETLVEAQRDLLGLLPKW